MPLNRHLLRYALAKQAAETTDTEPKTDVREEDESSEEREKERLGPYSADQAATVAGLDPQIAVMRRNRKEHPFHYWLNPFVRGPLSEIHQRLRRRTAASSASRDKLEKYFGATLGNPASYVVTPRGYYHTEYLHPFSWVTAALGHEGKREDARQRLQESGILEKYLQR
jgi:hypothetical protein